MYAIFHVTKDRDGLLVFSMGGLKVEEAVDDRQIIFYPMMNLPQQRFFSFLAGAQPVFCSDVFACCTRVRIRGTVKGSAAAVVSETAAVNSFTPRRKHKQGIQIAITSMKWVLPHAMMNGPNARNIHGRGISRCAL